MNPALRMSQAKCGGCPSGRRFLDLAHVQTSHQGQHRGRRAGLRREFEKLINAAAGFRCVATYPNAEVALAELPQHAPDLVLMDINLPGMSGIECVRMLRETLPKLPVVMLTVYEDSDALFKSLMAGANGYLLKRTPRAKLLEALREIHAGGAPMSRSIARKVVDFFHQVSRLPPTVVKSAELQC